VRIARGLLVWPSVQRRSFASSWSTFGRLLACTAVALSAILTHSDRATADGDKPLTHLEVVSVMSQRRGPIRKKCYEESPVKADASMRIDFVVAPTGIVTDVVARDVAGPEPIVSCVTAEMKKIIFPSSGSGGRFRWPFIFKGP
jgi:hypothetical protein